MSPQRRPTAIESFRPFRIAIADSRSRRLLRSMAAGTAAERRPLPDEFLQRLAEDSKRCAWPIPDGASACRVRECPLASSTHPQNQSP